MGTWYPQLMCSKRPVACCEYWLAFLGPNPLNAVILEHEYLFS
uniref:Uncharacterized protein n=1 Tax=Anguilla anguilla TaxID=7936 RepID=A0A0E9VCK9_ANGAN